MPATIVSSSISWSAYLGASLALAVVLSPAAWGVLGGSQASASSRTLNGVRDLLDSLKPGVKVSMEYGYPGLQGRVGLSGHTLTLVTPGVSLSVPEKWALPNMTLVPGQVYSLWIGGGSIQVDAVG